MVIADSVNINDMSLADRITHIEQACESSFSNGFLQGLSHQPHRQRWSLFHLLLQALGGRQEALFMVFEQVDSSVVAELIVRLSQGF